jgi:hypothetical protein
MSEELKNDGETAVRLLVLSDGVSVESSADGSDITTLDARIFEDKECVGQVSMRLSTSRIMSKTYDLHSLLFKMARRYRYMTLTLKNVPDA